MAVKLSGQVEKNDTSTLMGGWSRAYADYCSSLPAVEVPRVRSEGDCADGRRGLLSKGVEGKNEDVVVESEEIVGAAGSSGSSSSGTYFTATDTEEVKEV